MLKINLQAARGASTTEMRTVKNEWFVENLRTSPAVAISDAPKSARSVRTSWSLIAHSSLPTLTPVQRRNSPAFLYLSSPTHLEHPSAPGSAFLL